MPETTAYLRPPCNDEWVMKLWRECGLPEWFLGKAGTNYRLTDFASRISNRARPLDQR